jgi:hypothetical protein
VSLAIQAGNKLAICCGRALAIERHHVFLSLFCTTPRHTVLGVADCGDRALLFGDVLVAVHRAIATHRMVLT